jgi:hypothetical protein
MEFEVAQAAAVVLAAVEAVVLVVGGAEVEGVGQSGYAASRHQQHHRYSNRRSRQHFCRR